MTNDLAVANADSFGNITVSSVGGTGTQDIKESYTLDYSVISVTTAGYTELISTLVDSVTKLDVFDSSGEILELAVGAFYHTSGVVKIVI